MATVLFAVNRTCKAKAILRACEFLDGAHALAIESHDEPKRKLRWFAIFTETEGKYDAGQTVEGLLRLLSPLTVAVEYDTACVRHVRTFARTKRGIATRFASDEDCLAKQFSKGDHRAFWSEGVQNEKAWAWFVREDGEPRVRSGSARELPWGVEWSALVDWEPAPARSSSGRDVIERKRVGRGEALWTSDLAQWEHVDAAGSIAVARYEDERGLPHATLRTVSPSLKESFVRDEGRTIRLCHVDAHYASYLVDGSYRCIVRTDTSPPLTLGEAVPFAGARGLLFEGATITWADNAGIHRMERDGGDVRTLLADDPDRPARAQEPGKYLARVGEQLVFSGFRDDRGRMGIGAIDQAGGVRMLHETPGPDIFATSPGSTGAPRTPGSTGAPRTPGIAAWSDEGLLHIFDGRRVRTVDTRGLILALSACGDALLAVVDRGKGSKMVTQVNAGGAIVELGTTTSPSRVLWVDGDTAYRQGDDGLQVAPLVDGASGKARRSRPAVKRR